MADIPINGELLMPCACRNARKYLAQLLNSMLSIEDIANVVVVADRPEKQAVAYQLLEIDCTSCGNTGNILSRAGQDILDVFVVQLVRRQEEIRAALLEQMKVDKEASQSKEDIAF